MNETVGIIVAVLLGGGFVGGIVALLKVRPEAGRIVVDTAQGAVIVQTGVIDSLQEELERQKKENLRLWERLLEVERTSPSPDIVTQLNERVRILEEQNRTLATENVALKVRIRHLEEELTMIQEGGEK